MIKEDIIQRADEYLQKLTETSLKKYLDEIAQTQEFAIVYVQTMGDIFEDAEEYFDKYIYFFLLIHRSYTNRFRFFPKISMETIEKIEEENNNFFDKLSTKNDEEFESEMESYLSKHPQKTLIDFITLDLFESDEEAYDNIGLELDNQIFFLLITLINIYEESLINSQKEFNKKQ
jgi:hypothetical protein